MKMTQALQAGLLAVCALAIAACGGSNVNATQEDVLRRGISANPDTVDPHKSSAAWENIVIGDMFIGLFTDGVDGTPVLGMAESYEIDDTGTVWTFKLKDAVWSDGVPVTAGDFEYAYRRILNPETASQYASLQFLVKNAQAVYEGTLPPEELGVRAIDDKTVEITLEYPAPYLPGLLKHYTSFPVPRHVVEEFGDRWTRPENIQVNGPYKLAEWRTRDFLRSEVNPLFEGAENLCFREVYYLPYEDNDAVERFIQTGKMDMNNSFEGQRADELEERLPGWVRTSPGLLTTYYAFNTNIEPFDDVRVRRALAMALDRQFMTSEVLSAGYRPAYALVPPGMANYPGGPQAEFAGKPLEERLETAAALLREAGFGPENPLEFTYTYRSTDDNPKVAPAVQNSWKEIADWVNPTIEMQDTAVQYARLRQGDFEVGDAAWIADYNDAQNFLYLLDSKTGVMNYGNYNSPEFDALLAASNNERDMTKRGELLAQAEQLMLDDMPIIPMWFATTKNLVDPALTGYADNPEDVHRSRYLCRGA